MASRDLSFVAGVGRSLHEGGIPLNVYADISPNPRDDEIAAGRDVYRNGGHDGIIAIGGGSGMDGAKAVCLVAENDLDLWAFNFDDTSPDMTVHAIEAYCVPTFHPMCDGIALEGLRLINTWLRTAVRNPENLEARGGMLAGSCLAGVAFQKGLGLVHAISHMVGAEFDTHHGLTNAIVLPTVLRFNEHSIADKSPVMAQAMDLDDISFDGFYAAVCTILDDLEIPGNLMEINVPGGCAEVVAKKAHLDGAAETNPRTATVLEIQSIIEGALAGGR